MRNMPLQDELSRPQSQQRKQLPIEKPPAYPPPSSEATTSPPIDSAYASSIEKSQLAYEPASEAMGGGEMKQQEPIKGFSLYPQSQPPRSPSTHPAVPSAHLQMNDWIEDRKSVATSVSKGINFGSMRKYFHLRRGSKT